MRRLILIPVGLVLCWWAISMLRSLPVVEEAASRTDSATPAESQNAARKPQAVSVKTEAAPAGEAVAQGEVVTKAFEFQRELNTFIELQGKVFLSDEEKEVRRTLLSHVLLMRAVGKRLLTPAQSEALLREQEAGVDLLLAALKDGDSGLAAEVLREVIQDRQIEDQALAHGVREQLAGIKAEVLYHWAANDPVAASDMQRWLPGPVSRKIWDNVARRHAALQEESNRL